MEFSGIATGACSPGSGGGIGVISNGEASVPRWGIYSLKDRSIKIIIINYFA